MVQSTHVTIATSSGPLLWTLLVHFAGGFTGLVTGFAALAVAKGGAAHRRLGIVFVFAMIFMGVFAAGIALYEGATTWAGGLFTAYLVFTAMTTVRPLASESRGLTIALMLFAATVGAITIAAGIRSITVPARGVPSGMFFFLGTIMLLAAAGDLRVAIAGPLTGSARIARHLWRMCFGLFIASGSFFLGQMKFIPQQFRSMALLGALAIAPLVALVYWMWRVRFRKRMAGLLLARNVSLDRAVN